MTVSEFYRKMSEKIPASYSMEWDNDGLSVSPDLNREVGRILVTLDITEDVVDRAIAEGYDLILAHHPLLYQPMKAITADHPIGARIVKMLRAGVSSMSFHTRLDVMPGGVNESLSEALELKNVVRYPAGDPNALIRVGSLAQPMRAEDFAKHVKKKLGADAVKFYGPDRPVSRVAVVGGGGDSLVADAIAAGADTYLTGELKYHSLSVAKELGITLVEAGHYFTENPVCRTLASFARELLPNTDITLTDCNRIQTV